MSRVWIPFLQHPSRPLPVYKKVGVIKPPRPFPPLGLYLIYLVLIAAVTLPAYFFGFFKPTVASAVINYW